MGYKNYLLSCAAITALLSNQRMAAQGVNLSNVYVGEGAEMHIGLTTATIGANVSTARTATPGIMSFNTLASSILVTGYIDGAVRVYNNSGSSWLPVGQGTTGSGIALTGSVNPAQAVTALYTGTGAGNTILHNQAVFMVLNQEQWSITGNNSALLKLKWNAASGLSTMATAYSLETSDVIIAAWNGTQWVAIPSLADAGSLLANGSVTSTSNVDFSQYSLFTIAFKRECAAIVDATSSTVWNGSTWSNGLPSEFKSVIINAPLTVTPATSFVANSVAFNAAVTIQNAAYIDIVKDATGSAVVSIASEGSLVQRSSAGQAPSILLTKTTRPLRKWDNVYWGTPIAQDFSSQLTNAKAVGSELPAFENPLKYVSEAGANGSWKPLTATVPGQGFIARIKGQAPFIDEAVTAQINFPIQGTANNGNVIAQLGSATSGARSYNLLANPYPSAIDAGAFLRDNPNLGGAVYLWTSKAFNSSGTTADYAIWTLAGSVAVSPLANLSPTGYIASGQSFMVKGLTAGGTVNFSNCMRVEGNNTNFFRQGAMDRYWLNLTNGSGIFSQVLVNYMEDASYDYDRLYDAPRNSVSTAQLYSYIQESKYAINSRPQFNAADIVPLGVSRTDADADIFTIALHQPEGLFAGNTVVIYLHDKVLDIYHNLNRESYTFSALELQNNDRFEVVYETREDVALNTEDNIIKSTAMTINGGNFKLSAKLPVSEVAVYDLTGRMIQQYSAISNTVYAAPFHHAQGVYIAKAKLENGSIVTQKLVNGK